MISSKLEPDHINVDWWPTHVQKAFAALGRVLGRPQLTPQMLQLVDRFSALPGHEIIYEHVSGKETGTRKGFYRLYIRGPVFEGQWLFKSGDLEQVARAAAKKLG
jgi:hypothetical protein